MANVVGYARPVTLAEALGLLGRPGTIALAGGTTLASTTTGPVVAVDLQSLELDAIERVDHAAIRIGATATLQALVDEAAVPPVVREAARRERPGTLRAAATVGGCIVACDFESELLAALLVHEALVTFAGGEAVGLAEVLERGLRHGQLLTGVTIATSGVSVLFRTARTRADRAIVAAAARRAPSGELRLALAGVADRPLLLAGVGDIDPPGDHRGSAEYRRALAETLAGRALAAVAR